MKKLLLCFAVMTTAGCTTKEVLADQTTIGGTTSSSSGSSSSGSGGIATAASDTTAGTSSATSSGSGSSSSGASATGSASSSGTGAGSTSGTVVFADGGFGCPVGFAYLNGDCIAGEDCTGLSNSEPCTIDGGLGACANGTCVVANLQTDPNNCGQVGIVCSNGNTCISGLCTSNSLKCDCPTGRVCINGTCYFDSTCTGAPPLATCFTSAQAEVSGTCCNGACLAATDLISDNANCGGCGIACAAGAICVDDVCLPTTCASDAPAGSACVLPDGGKDSQTGQNAACCGGTCTDLTLDAKNCGYCNAECPSGASCFNGACTTLCNTNTDCGAGFGCWFGACYPTTCPASESGTLCAVVYSPTLVGQGACCDGTCTSLESDPDNCGACGASCGGGSCFEETCSGDTIVPCSGANTACTADGPAGQCCSGTCMVFASDDNNCGACGRACPGGSSCFNGQCVNSGGFQACANDSQCPTGHACQGGECVTVSCAGATDSQACVVGDGGPGVCCNGSCSDLISDSQNCQVCGRICPAGSSCQGQNFPDGPLANCQLLDSLDSATCLPGQAQCPAGTVCGPDESSCVKQTLSCVGVPDGTTCSFGATAAGVIYGECCGGTCVNVSADANNCGYCGAQCLSGVCTETFNGPGCLPTRGGQCAQTCAAGTACLGATCVSVTCFLEGAPCPAADGNLGICSAIDGGTGSSCFDVLNDPANCGSIGSPCLSGQSCTQGVCSGTPEPCDAPAKLNSYCNLDGGLGYVCCQGLGCIDTDTDPQNCGDCGFACLSGQSCSAGSCG